MASKAKVNKKTLDPRKADVVATVTPVRKGSAPKDANLNNELKDKIPGQMFTVLSGTVTREQREKERRNTGDATVEPTPLRLDIPKAEDK